MAPRQRSSLLALIAALLSMASAKDFTPVPNADFPGNTISVLTNTPPAACLAACLAMPACVMYEVGSLLVYPNRCWLKSAVAASANLYIGLTSYIPQADGIVQCSVNYDSCDGSFAPGGNCPASASGACGNGYSQALNAAARAITMLTAAPVTAGDATAGLSAMHLPAFIKKLNVRNLISTAISAPGTLAACSVNPRSLYSGSSIASVAKCSHPDLADGAFYFLLAGSYNGFSGCVALDPCSAQIPISVVGKKLDVFSNSVALLSSADLPTRVLAPLDVAMFAIKGDAPMRDRVTGAVQGSATGHLSFRGVTLVQVSLDALAFSANGPASTLINFDPADDGFGTPDHAVTLRLDGGPSLSYGPAGALEALDFTAISGLSTSLSWTFLNASAFAFQAQVSGGGLTLAALLAKSSVISSALASQLTGPLNAGVALTVTVTPEVWSLALDLAGPVTLLLADPLNPTTQLLGSDDVITISGTRASAAVAVAALLTAPGTGLLSTLTLAGVTLG